MDEQQHDNMNQDMPEVEQEGMETPEEEASEEGADQA